MEGSREAHPILRLYAVSSFAGLCYWYSFYPASVKLLSSCMVQQFCGFGQNSSVLQYSVESRHKVTSEALK